MLRRMAFSASIAEISSQGPQNAAADLAVFALPALRSDSLVGAIPAGRQQRSVLN